MQYCVGNGVIKNTPEANGNEVVGNNPMEREKFKETTIGANTHFEAI